MSDKTDKEIVEAATPGPWEIFNESDIFGNNKGIIKVIRFHKHTFKNDAQYIAHFNPLKVKEMLAENQRYLSAIKAFCEASKHGDPHWKKQDYIAALFEIANTPPQEQPK